MDGDLALLCASNCQWLPPSPRTGWGAEEWLMKTNVDSTWGCGVRYVCVTACTCVAFRRSGEKAIPMHSEAILSLIQILCLPLPARSPAETNRVAAGPSAKDDSNKPQGTGFTGGLSLESHINLRGTVAGTVLRQLSATL